MGGGGVDFPPAIKVGYFQHKLEKKYSACPQSPLSEESKYTICMYIKEVDIFLCKDNANSAELHRISISMHIVSNPLGYYRQWI